MSSARKWFVVVGKPTKLWDKIDLIPDTSLMGKLILGDCEHRTRRQARQVAWREGQTNPWWTYRVIRVLDSKPLIADLHQRLLNLDKADGTVEITVRELEWLLQQAESKDDE